MKFVKKNHSIVATCRHCGRPIPVGVGYYSNRQYKKSTKYCLACYERLWL